MSEERSHPEDEAVAPTLLVTAATELLEIGFFVDGADAFNGDTCGPTPELAMVEGGGGGGAEEAADDTAGTTAAAEGPPRAASAKTRRKQF